MRAVEIHRRGVGRLAEGDLQPEVAARDGRPSSAGSLPSACPALTIAMLATLGLAVVLFASTNIDDVFVLVGFFADPRFHARAIIVGQYLGIAALVAASILAAWLALALPTRYAGLLGLLPIAIGLKKLFSLRKPARQDEASAPSRSGLGNIAAVAAVTMANGGDNIGVYTPVFATVSGNELAIIVAAFAVMVAIWIAVAHWLVTHPMLGAPIRRFGQRLTPIVLIGLGVYV